MIGEILQGTYRVERLIGEGRMGKVYEASHLRLPRRFAVKAMSTKLADNKEALIRFQREAELTSQLGHPNIVEVVDFNRTDDGAPYIVMELLTGMDLQRFNSEVPRPSMAQIAAIVQQAASALQAAHDEGIVHRDLKPSNLFITLRRHRPDVVKVVDFGISKILGSQSQLTASDSLLGTPHYMAPEQAEGNVGRIDRRTDVYALGAILYELVTGHRPFDADSLLAVLYKVVQSVPAPARELRPEIPPAVEDVVMRAISRSPDQRFPTTTELSEAFLEACGETPAERLLPDTIREADDGGVGATEVDRPDADGDAGTLEEAVTAPVPLSGSDELANASTEVDLDPPGPLTPPEPPTRMRPTTLRQHLPLVLVSVALLAVGGLAIGYALLDDLPKSPRPVAAPVKRPYPGRASAAPLPVAPDAAAAAAADAARATPVAQLQPAPKLKTRRPGRGRPTRPGRRSTATGSLSISTLLDGEPRPATIHIDRVGHGKSPLFLDRIAVGPHTVKATRPGCRPSVRRITVRAGENSVVVHLRRSR